MHILSHVTRSVVRHQEYTLRGSSSAVASFDKVQRAASAAVVGGHKEDECEDFPKKKSEWCNKAHKDCCSTEEEYDDNFDFCDFYGFDEAKGIVGDTQWSFSTEDVDCNKCDDEKCDDNNKKHNDDDDDDDYNQKKHDDDDDDDDDDDKKHDDEDDDNKNPPKKHDDDDDKDDNHDKKQDDKDDKDDDGNENGPNGGGNQDDKDGGGGGGGGGGDGNGHENGPNGPKGGLMSAQ